jgi:hypothetical protein
MNSLYNYELLDAEYTFEVTSYYVMNWKGPRKTTFLHYHPTYEIILEAFLKIPSHRDGHLNPVRIDVLKNFGYFSTESNGHLSEYLAWYRKRPEDLDKWIEKIDNFGGGATAGYLNYLTTRQNFFETDFLF